MDHRYTNARDEAASCGGVVWYAAVALSRATFVLASRNCLHTKYNQQKVPMQRMD
jgi:hypothetical protein